MLDSPVTQCIESNTFALTNLISQYSILSNVWKWSEFSPICCVVLFMVRKSMAAAFLLINWIDFLGRILCSQRRTFAPLTDDILLCVSTFRHFVVKNSMAKHEYEYGQWACEWAQRCDFVTRNANEMCVTNWCVIHSRMPIAWKKKKSVVYCGHGPNLADNNIFGSGKRNLGTNQVIPNVLCLTNV